jgi:maleate isomerase
MAADGTMDPTIPVAPVRAFADPPHVDAAVELLAASPLGAIAFGFTSSAYVIGGDGEAAMIGRGFYEQAGFEVTSAGPCDLPSDQWAITPEGLHDHVLAAAPDGAEAVVIGGNGFRAVGAIEALEEALGRPVLTANQVLLRAALRAAGGEAPQVEGYGRLFTLA